MEREPTHSLQPASAPLQYMVSKVFKAISFIMTESPAFQDKLFWYSLYLLFMHLSQRKSGSEAVLYKIQLESVNKLEI